MDRLGLKIDKVFKGAGKSFYRFPAAIISAMMISIVAIIRISMEWKVQEGYNLLFDSIQMSLVLGAVFSMATVLWSEIKVDQNKRFFVLANISGALVDSISFLLLYFYGGRALDNQVVYLSSIAIARVSVGILISIIAFVYLISKAKSVSRFSDAFFITHKAFIVSAIYGLVIMAGTSGVLGAFEALIYNSMDYRVYQYLGVGVGFLTYMIFLGYFPSFKEMANEIEVRKIKEQPRFIVVLFDYILIPIMLALTVVLVIWSMRVILTEAEVSFSGLSGIASSYVMIGIWLHIMVAKYESPRAMYYKKVYPTAGLLILAFEAWALYHQLSKFGLKTGEYSFLMIWIFGLISVLLLVFLKEEAYRKIAITAIVIASIWVLPIIGYQDITFNSQVGRLEKRLIAEQLLVGGQLIAAEGEIDYIRRGEITDAVDFISYSEKPNKPTWFKEDLSDGTIFKDSFGFEKTYGLYDDELEYRSTNFRLEATVIDISDYALSLNLNDYQEDRIEFEREDGGYEIIFSNQYKGIPEMRVKHEGRIIIEEDMASYLVELTNKYPIEENGEMNLPLEEMSMVLEGEGLSLLIVINHIDAYFDKREDKMDYYVDLHGVYVKDY